MNASTARRRAPWRRAVRAVPARAAIVVALLAAGCRPAASPVTGGVGFTVGVPGAALKSGALVTVPAGREEQLLPFVANLALRAATACRDGQLPEGPARIEVILDASGRVREARPTGEHAMVRCLAERAMKEQAQAPSLPNETRALISFLLARSAPPDAR